MGRTGGDAAARRCKDGGPMATDDEVPADAPTGDRIGLTGARFRARSPGDESRPPATPGRFETARRMLDDAQAEAARTRDRAERTAADWTARVEQHLARRLAEVEGERLPDAPAS